MLAFAILATFAIGATACADVTAPQNDCYDGIQGSGTCLEAGIQGSGT